MLQLPLLIYQHFPPSPPSPCPDYLYQYLLMKYGLHDQRRGEGIPPASQQKIDPRNAFVLTAWELSLSISRNYSLVWSKLIWVAHLADRFILHTTALLSRLDPLPTPLWLCIRIKLYKHFDFLAFFSPQMNSVWWFLTKI